MEIDFNVQHEYLYVYSVIGALVIEGFVDVKFRGVIVNSEAVRVVSIDAVICSKG